MSRNSGTGGAQVDQMQSMTPIEPMTPMQNPIAARPGASHKTETIPISVGGNWIDAPLVRVNGQDIVVKGKRIKIARLHDEDWLENELADPEACIRACKEQSGSARADIFSFSQKVPDIAPRYRYANHPRSLAVACVADYPQWLKQLSDSSRKNIKRAAKRGVVVKVKEFAPDVIEGIREVQNETPVRQGRHFRHYGKPYEQVRRDHGAFLDRSDFLCAYFEDEFIGFIKLVYRGGVASLLQILTKTAHYDKRAANALLAKAAERCAEKGVPYLTYDLFNYGNKHDTSLREFKERHGFFEMQLPCYYVPLTAWGGACLKTGLYRGWHGILPHSVLTAAVNLRAKWYQGAHR